MILKDLKINMVDKKIKFHILSFELSSPKHHKFIPDFLTKLFSIIQLESKPQTGLTILFVK